jgi:hypothetical protein
MKITYKTINVTLAANSQTAEKGTKIPSGKIIAIGTVSKGNTDGEIIDLSLLDNNNEILSPCDLSFSEKTSGGRWIDSMRPVNLDGGREIDAKLYAYTSSRANEIKVQVLFAVLEDKNETIPGSC